MGLDSVELVLATEEAFQISIEDEEAGRVITIGDLYNLVLSKLEDLDSKRCLTSSAFYRLRRSLMETVGISRNDIQPSTSLDVILPRSARRARWKKLQEIMPLRLPPLTHSGPVTGFLLAAGFFLAMLPGVYLHAGSGFWGVLGITGLIMGGLLIRLTPSLATAFANHDRTVGDLAQTTLAMNFKALSAELQSHPKSDVWQIIQKIVVRQLGVTGEKVTPEARFVDDLGMD